MNKKIKTYCYHLLLICLAVISGCMVGPDYERPATAADDGFFFFAGKHTQDINELDPSHLWWRRFADETTAELVLEALENNYDLKASAARVLQAQAGLKEAKGQLLPQVNYGMSRSRSKSSFDFGMGPSTSFDTTWGQELSVSWVLDFFGKLRRARQAAWSDMLASQANQQALTNSIIASVIISRVDIATIQKRLDIAKANTKSRENTLEIVERRYKQGLVSPVDVRLARENLAASQSTEAVVELSLIKAHNALDVLLARRPGSGPELPRTLEQLPNLDSIPVGLPGALLDRRPDVVAAEMSLRSFSERIGISIAQMYPDLTLTGAYGFSDESLHDIFNKQAEIYSLIFSLAQPVFRGGILQANVDAAKARYEEAAANYAKTVLTAMKEVEDSLISEQMLQTQLKHVELQFDQARAAEDLSTERYSRGVESILTVLESERRRRLAEEQLTILKGQIWINRVNLFLALGGDWTNDQNHQQLPK